MTENGNPSVNVAPEVEAVARASHAAWYEALGAGELPWQLLAESSKALRYATARAAIVAVRQWDEDHRCVACGEPHAARDAAFGPGCGPES